MSGVAVCGHEWSIIAPIIIFVLIEIFLFSISMLSLPCAIKVVYIIVISLSSIVHLEYGWCDGGSERLRKIIFQPQKGNQWNVDFTATTFAIIINYVTQAITFAVDDSLSQYRHRMSCAASASFSSLTLARFVRHLYFIYFSHFICARLNTCRDYLPFQFVSCEVVGHHIERARERVRHTIYSSKRIKVIIIDAVSRTFRHLYLRRMALLLLLPLLCSNCK